MFKMLSDFLKRYKFTLLIMLCFAITIHMQRHINMISILNTLFLILYLHLFGRGRFRFIFLTLFSIILSCDVFFAFFFRGRITYGTIASVFEATTADAKGVLPMLPWIILFFSITFLLVFLSANEFGKLRIRRKYAALMLAVYLIIGIPSYMFYKIRSYPDKRITFKDSPVLTLQFMFWDRFPFVYNSLFSTFAYCYEMHQVQTYAQQERSLPDGLSLSPDNGLLRKIYFVCGESQWYRHLSIYGYHIRTTSFLDSLLHVSDNRMTVYHGAFAPGCLTRDAQRLLLSFATPQHASPFFTQKNILEMAKDAGYHSLYLTSQKVHSGLYDSYAAMISRSADFFHCSEEFNKLFLDDMLLLPVIKEQNRSDGKQFYYINLTGSHAPYSSMYDQTDRDYIPGNDVIADYDRTIHHTDRFMRELIKLIEKDSTSVFVYISDHAEDLEYISSHSENPGFGHGLLGRGSSQFEVPFLVINQSKTSVDPIINKYFIPGKNKINTLSITYILAELMGYVISDELLAYVHQQSNYIFHVDGNWHEYEQIEAENKSAK